MNNNFENRITNLQNFNLKPNNYNWDEIEKQLPQEKKRRIIAWWWSLPILLIGIVAYKLLDNTRTSQNQSKVIVIEQLNKQHNYSINSPKNIKIEATAIDNKLSATQKNQSDKLLLNLINISSNNKYLKPKTKQSQPNNYATKKLSINTNNWQKSITDESGKKEEKLEENMVTKNNVESSTTQFATATSKKFENEKENEKHDTIIEKNVAVAALQNDKSKMPIHKKWQFEICAGIGVNYLSTNNVFGLQPNNNSSYNLAISTGTSTSATKNISLPTTGFTINLGIQAKYNLSSKITFATGLQYRYLQNNLNVENNLATASTYVTTNSTSYKNHFHLAEIPMHFLFSLNAKSKTKVSLITGATVSFTISNNWLFVNSSQGYFESMPNNINKTFCSFQLGSNINFNNKFSVNIIASKSITSVQSQSQQYFWQQLNLQTNLPLNILKHKK